MTDRTKEKTWWGGGGRNGTQDLPTMERDEVYAKGSVKLWEVFISAVCFCYFGGSICIICWGGVWLLLL